jgi:hypothetical protein
VEEAIKCFVTLASARQMLVKKYNGRNSNAPANSVADRRRRAALGSPGMDRNGGLGSMTDDRGPHVPEAVSQTHMSPG